MVKCIAYKASPHSHISEPVHDIWLVFPPTWTTRQICKQRGLALREINGPRAGNRVTLATLEKYIDGQCHLWKDLQSKGKMMEEIFAYWSMGNHSGLYMIVLNFRLTKTSCLWPIKHAFTSALAIKNYIKKSEWNNWFRYPKWNYIVSVDMGSDIFLYYWKLGFSKLSDLRTPSAIFKIVSTSSCQFQPYGLEVLQLWNPYPTVKTIVSELWCWRRLLRVLWTAKRSNLSTLKEINPEYSLEGLMLKLKLWYFGDLMQRGNSLEKTLMLANIEGRRRRGRQRTR